ncbi:hypothetical protein LZ575_10860 [Antarcticibacterium sp. 1MA-6-2]|uniref:ROK family protein n=1 Tax=Antarcticibacterium sp. 1MA-6-2 TaxID=2908210 RepID=UPI001F2AF3C6|nr:hypothetical protein [Antarcticibacterium sp. 1MA-6-2]UJH92864.1 hypothetical protein LZ575_10860 [Antarcticibacterium sp. 1MA-6-2]
MKINKTRPVTIGVDIGGSHVSCAALNHETYKPIPGSLFTGKVDSKASKDSILRQWSEVINKVLLKVENEEISGIGIAMPGPFNYDRGIALFKTNDKYETLYNVSIVQELPKFITLPQLPIRFLNDASSFGIGGGLQYNLGANTRIIALTLGTRFWSSFY